MSFERWLNNIKAFPWPFDKSSLETGQKQLANDKRVLEAFILSLTR